MPRYPGTPLRASTATSSAVRELQERLNALKVAEIGGGRKLEADGLFGPATENAVRLFQAQSTDAAGRPLEIDGVVGPVTWAALFGTKPATIASTTDPLLGKVLEVASKEVGVREDPLGTNRGPRVDQYLTCCGMNPQKGNYAWCAAFVYFCFEQAAAELSRSNPVPKTAGVHDLWNRIGSKGLYRITAGQSASHPELVLPGMLFFLDAGGGCGHVGIVKAVRGVDLATIEGNTTDKRGSREGIGVFERSQRRIPAVNLGFADVSRRFS